MAAFAEATQAREFGQEGGLRRFAADLDPQWTIGNKLHGGYLLAVVARAAAEVGGAEQPHPTAVSASFSRPPEPGAALVEVETLRVGRGTTQLRARLSQQDQPCVEVLITQGRLDESDAWWNGTIPAGLPAEHECFRLPVDNGAGFPLRLMEVVETRMPAASLAFAMGNPTRTGVFSSWQRLVDGSDWDPFSILVALDPAPPVSFDLGLSGWAPTVQMSAYPRRLPAPGPVRVSMHATDIGEGRMVEIATAWDSKDRLVAQATQLAGVRTP
jgi:Acyl-CoA thioesterase N-terminal domain/Acyl-CoA thioesterase C-terminal domain